jgi:cell division protein ZipA
VSGLAWALLAAGALLVAGVYAWGQFRLRRRERRIVEHMFDRAPIGDLPPLPGARASDREEASALADLHSLTTERSEPAELGGHSTRTPARRRTRAERHGQASLELDEPSRPAQPPAPVLLALHVMAREGQAFSGTALERALREANLQHGEMNIYHHHGVGSATGEVPVFSLANMFEPGTFDPATMDDFETRGIALFMQLPGPLDGAVAFELMLASAQSITSHLDGLLLNGQRQPLRAEDVQSMRAQAARHRVHGA